MKLAAGAHSGTGMWLMQRATALLLAIALPALCLYVFAAMPLDFLAWQALLIPLWVRVLLLLIGGSLALHVWVGMRDIFMDYIHPLGIRLAMLLAVIVVLAASVVWLAAILFSMNRWGGA